MPVTKIRTKWSSGALYFTDNTLSTTLLSISTSAVTTGDVGLTIGTSGNSIGTSGVITNVGAGSTGTTIANNGFTYVGSSAAKTYNLAAPAAGVEKQIYCSQGGSTTTQTISLSTGGTVTILGSTTTNNLVFNAALESVTLKGVSVTRWAVVNNTGAVALST
jgi:hypothetical protein